MSLLFFYFVVEYEKGICGLSQKLISYTNIMKKVFISTLLLLVWFSQWYANVEDNSIIDELTTENTKQLDIDFGLQNFESCSAFEDVMETYMKAYWKNNYRNRWGFGFFRKGIISGPTMMEETVESNDSSQSIDKTADVSRGVDWRDKDISKTNTQVLGVDESDMVKTDGKYHYYYNETKKAVYIVDAKNDLKVIKKINLPDGFYNPQLYIDVNRLVILASGYSNTDYSKRGYYFNRNTKTYSIVFDTSDINNPKLIKLHSSDGSFSKSRKIGDYVYVLSTNHISYPYWNIKSEDEIVIEADKMLPRKIDISKTIDTAKQNFVLKGKKFPYNIKAGKISDCNSISYSLPDEETLKKIDFNPGYNIISAININNVSQEVETHVVAGSNNEIYMSLDNLYLTEGIWQPEPFSCPADAICAMPFFWGGTQNTMIHKMNIDGKNVKYQDSALVPWAPLNQYSMDEHKWDFRIITSQWRPERSTWLYVLDKDLEKVSSLTNLAPGEDFKSSRFMWDKLYLVTFEQIDPLFAIDLADRKAPKVLGELKIPGFSTYLHPYDETHIIGLGYDTKQNERGGTTTAGLKIDLYKMHFDKKCGDSNLTAQQKKKCESGDYKGIIVEQKYTETLGGKGSYSEALNNPRMFMWNKDRKTLLLPADVYEKDDNWKTLDYYGGLYTISIDKDSGIKVKDKTTHIDLNGLEEKRKKECARYSTPEEEEVTCRELLDGTMDCSAGAKKRSYNYIPNYCYKDTSIWQYIGDKSWEFADMRIKRALYVWDNVYGLSDSKITSHDWDLNTQKETSFE